MSAAKEQLTRMLALVPYLRERRDLSVDEVAATFGVSPTRIVADLRVLYMCGLPGMLPDDMIEVDMDAFERDGDRIVRLDNVDYLSRPLRLDSSEAAALVLALRALRATASDESRAVIDRALVKLEAATADGQSGGHVIDVPERPGAVHRPDLERALAQGRRVELTYLTATRDDRTVRVVDPVAIVTHQGQDYLDAWCHRAEDRRTFRLDRIEALRVTDDDVSPHDLEPLDLGEGLFRPAPADLRATLRLAPEVRWVAEYHPTESVTELEDGRLEISLRVGDPRWLLRLVMRLAPYAEIVEPVDLRECLLGIASDVLGAYRPSTAYSGDSHPRDEEESP